MRSVVPAVLLLAWFLAGAVVVGLTTRGRPVDGWLVAVLALGVAASVAVLVGDLRRRRAVPTRRHP